MSTARHELRIEKRRRAPSSSWLSHLLLIATLVLAGLTLRRIWHGAVGGATIPIPTAVLGVMTLLGIVAWYAERRLGPRARLIVSRLALSAASVAIALLATEILLRRIFLEQLGTNTIERLRAFEEGEDVPIRSAHPLAHIVRLSSEPGVIFELKPNLDIEFGHRRLVTNRHGMRSSRDYAYARTPNSVRIVGVGDSGMFGWSMEQGEDYLAVLEANLNEREDGVLYEVLNLAVPGCNTYQEVEMLRSKGIAFDPDVVVLGWNENDFDFPFFVIQKENLWRTDVSYLWSFLFDPPRIQQLLQERIRDYRTRDVERIADPVVANSGPEGVRSSFESLRRMSGERGFRVLVFGPMGEAAVDIVSSAGLEFYNTYEEIPAGLHPDEYAVHFMHPRKEGHRVLAEHLEQALESRGWLEPVVDPSA